jgi:hypothetical protein
MRAAWIAILLVSQAAAESQLTVSSRDTASHAAGRVDFKIIIPTVLYLSVADDAEAVLGGKVATIVSNGRSVTFRADPRGNGITLLGRRHVIVAHTPCSYAAPSADNNHPPALTCTVAAP